jgi:hypothetical protein
MDIETIGVAMDTSDLERGNRVLGETEQAANKASVAADRLSDSTKTVSWQNQQMNQTVKQSAAATEDMSVKAQKLADQMYKEAQAADLFMAKLQRMAETAGKTNVEILRQQAALHGVTEGADPLIEKLEAAAASQHKLSFATAGVTRELSVMGSEAMRGNWTRLEGSMTVLANRTGLLQMAFSPMGALVLGVVASLVALGAAVHHVESFDRAVNSMETALSSTGRQSVASTAQLKDMVFQLSLMPGITKEAAEQSILVLARSHDIGSQLFRDLQTAAVDYAAVTGQKLPEAMKELAKDFSDPEKGAKSLDQALGTLTANELQQIHVMMEHNDLLGAQHVLLDALKAATLGAATQGLTPMQQATNDLSKAWSTMLHGVGDSAVITGARTAFIGLLEGVTWLTAKLPDLASTLAMAIPGLNVVINAMRMAGDFQKQQAQRTSGGKIGTDPDVQNMDDQIKRAIALGEAYKSLAGQKQQLAVTEGVLQSALKESNRLYGVTSESSKKLRDELQGLHEQMAKKGVDSINAEMEALKKLGNAQDSAIKMAVQTYESLVKQGQMTELEGIKAVEQAELAGVEAKKQILAQELSIAAKKIQNATEVARITGELANLEIQKQNIVQTAVNKTAEAQKRADDIQKQLADNEYKASQQRITAVTEQADAIQLELDANVKSKQAIQETIIARLEEQRTILAGFDGSAQKIQQINDEIDARKRLVTLLNQKDVQDANDRAAKKAAEAWQRTSDQIERSLESAILDGGKNAGKQLERYFAHMILQPILQPIAQGAASLVQGGVNALMGGASSGAMGAAGGASTGLYGAIMGGYSGAGAAGFAAAGGSFASTVGGGLATDAMGATVIEGAAAATIETGAVGAISAGLAAIPVVGWIGLAAMALYKIFGSSGGGPKVESGFGAVPHQWQGDAAPATQLAQGLQQQYASIASTLGVTNTTLSNLTVFFAKDPQGTAKTQLQVAGGSYDRSAMLGGYENVGRSDSEFQAAVALASTQFLLKNLQDNVSGPVGDYLKSVNITSASLETMQHALQVAQDVGNLNKVLDAVGSSFDNLRTLSIENKEAIIDQAGGFQTLQTEMGAYYSNFFTDAEKHDASMSQLTTTFQKINLAVPATRDAYRQLVDAQDLTTEAGRNNYTVLMANASAFAALVPAVSDVTGAVTDAVETVDDALNRLNGTVRSAQDIAQNILDLHKQTGDLRVQLLTAQGNTSGARALQEMFDTAGMTEAEQAIYYYNQGLQDQIDLANEAAAALTKMNQQTAQLNSEQQSLQVQLLSAQGDTTGAASLQRTIDTAGMTDAQIAIYDYNQQLKLQIADANNAAQALAAYNAQQAQTNTQLAKQTATLQVALAKAQGNDPLAAQLQRTIDITGLTEAQVAVYDYNASIQTQIDALNAAAVAAQQAAAHEQQVAQERKGLMQQLYQLEGNTAALRAMELAQLDPSNQELQKRIWALQDEKDAAAKLLQKQQEAAQAAKALKDAWQGVATSIFQEVNRIHGLMNSPGQNLGSLQSKFNSDVALALQGNQDAAKDLPGISQQLLTVAESTATSALDLARIRGQVASQLETVGTVISARYGLDTSTQMVQELQSVNSNLKTLKTTTDNLTTHAKNTSEKVTKMQDDIYNIRNRGVFVQNAPDTTLATS